MISSDKNKLKNQVWVRKTPRNLN